MKVPRTTTIVCTALVAIGVVLLVRPQLLAARLFGAGSSAAAVTASLRLAEALAGAFAAMGVALPLTR